MNKIKIAYPIIVEGRYDKIHLDSILDAKIFVCDGFSIFKRGEKAALFRRLAQKGKIIVLTDPDSGGKVIRGHLSSVLPKEAVIHLYVPAVAGKEKRKEKASKAGFLGVEGIDAEKIRAIFAPFSAEAVENASAIDIAPVTKTELYFDGLSGGEGAKEKRRALCVALELPPDLSASALVEAINLLSLGDVYRAWIRGI